MCFASTRSGRVAGRTDAGEGSGRGGSASESEHWVGKAGRRQGQQPAQYESFFRMDTQRATADRSCGSASIGSPAAHEESCCSGAIRAIRTRMPMRQAGHRRKVSGTGEIAA
jgi:hypothetical protein